MKLPRFLRLELVLVVVFGVLPLLYGAGYVWARLTHRLVWYGSSVAGPNMTSGIGFTDWELFFMPAILAETAVRPHSD